MTAAEWIPCGNRVPDLRGNGGILICDLRAGHDTEWHETISAGDSPLRWRDGVEPHHLQPGRHCPTCRCADSLNPSSSSLARVDL